jgi:hypothetical protein
MTMALHGRGGLRAFAVLLALSALLARASATSPKTCAGADEADDMGLLQSRTARSAGKTTDHDAVSEAFGILSEMVGCALNSTVTECFTDPLFERVESLLPAVKDVIWSLPAEEREKLGRLLDAINTLGESARESLLDETNMLGESAGKTTDNDMTTNLDALSEAFGIVSEMVGCAVEFGVHECFTDLNFERLESLLPAVKDVIWSLPVADRVKLGRLLDAINTLGEESTTTDPDDNGSPMS